MDVGPSPPDPGGGGGEPIYDAVPKQLLNAKKVSRDYCQNSKTVFYNMYRAQETRHKEQVAFVTDKGIFWLDDSENTNTTYYVGKPSDYPVGPDGKRYCKYP
ncbi:hypothetical protein [Fibrisoma limi]|uniref:hypothetical protein n=1 Tax=Fibrisoma limi TaxID=663275 RepID=UPI001181C6E3|nr:hypothetical protein [Fibrisoma limi]